MTIANLKRVMNRIRAVYPGRKKITWLQLKRCIMIECGTSPACFYQNKRALIDLGWIRTKKKWIHLTDLDLTDDYDYYAR